MQMSDPLFNKKIFFLATSAIILLAACSPESVPPPPPNAPPAAPTQAISLPSPFPSPVIRTRTAVANAGTPTAQPASVLVPAAFDKFSIEVALRVEGEFIVLKSNGVPPHGSPYFARNDSRYQAYNGSNPNFRVGPNLIKEQTLEFRIPLNPKKSDRPAPTLLGPIGIALDGVALFNQYQGQGQPLTNEINGFDQFNGHPTPDGLYHYHVEPLFLTQRLGKDSLLGFLLDGFPVYGPMENGKPIANKDLDAFHGHSHATADYPQGIYHYHVTPEAPYINGSGFYGTAGRVTVR